MRKTWGLEWHRWDSNPALSPMYSLTLLAPIPINSQLSHRCLSIAIPVSATSSVFNSIFFKGACLHLNVLMEGPPPLCTFSLSLWQSLLFQGGLEFQRLTWLAQGHTQSAGSSINMPKSNTYLSRVVPYKRHIHTSTWPHESRHPLLPQ